MPYSTGYRRGMSRVRVRVVNSALAVLIAGSLIDIATGREHWPFSPYAMFADHATSRTVSKLILMGVTRDEHREVPLRHLSFIRPFDRSRLMTALERMSRGQRSSDLLNEALHDCLRRYERRGREGRHSGPPLEAVRLYLFEWEVDARRSSLDRPTRRRLVAEASRTPVGS